MFFSYKLFVDARVSAFEFVQGGGGGGGGGVSLRTFLTWKTINKTNKSRFAAMTFVGSGSLMLTPRNQSFRFPFSKAFHLSVYSYLNARTAV